MVLANSVLKKVMFNVIEKDFDDYNWEKFLPELTTVDFTIKGQDPATLELMLAMGHIDDQQVKVVIFNNATEVVSTCYYTYDKIVEGL